MHSAAQLNLFGYDGPAAYWSLTSILVIAAGLLVGRLLRRLWNTGDESLAERLVIDTAMGLGALSLVILGLGIFQLYGYFWVFSIILALAGITGLTLLLRDTLSRSPEEKVSGQGAAETTAGDVSGRGVAETTRAKNGRRASIVLWVLFGLLFIAAAIPAMTPASMSDWDSLAYHLAVPKLYLQHGGIYKIGIMSHSHFPMLVEMLYLPGLALGIAGAGKMVSFWITVLMVAAVAITASCHFGGKSVPLAALAIAGMPIVLWEATTGYVDTAPALYTVLAVYFLLKYLDAPDLRSLVGCGVAAGFCASTKMTGLAIIPLLVAWLLAGRLAAARKIEWKGALALAFAGAVVALPWYLKSIIYTGNPVYPFFYSIFGGDGWSAQLAKHYAEQQALFGMGHNLPSLLLAPFDLTFYSGAFYDKPGLFIGPLMLAAVPVLLVARYGSRKLVGLLLVFLAHVGIWFALTQQSRYLIPAFALLAMLVAGLLYQDERLRRARSMMWAVLGATALFGVCTLVPQVQSAAPYVLGTESQDEYLSKTIDLYDAQHYINRNLPPNAKIALYGDTRGFFLDRDYVWADPGHSVTYTRNFGSTIELVSFLKSRGITHALVNLADWFPKRGEATGAHKLVYEAIDDGHFELVYPGESGEGHVGVFEVR